MTIHITLKGGPGSGWHAPSRGTHTGDKHRAVGSGKSVKPKTSDSAQQLAVMQELVDTKLKMQAIAYAEGTMDLEHVRIAEEYLKEYTHGNPVAINIPSGITINILESGVFKNQHDTAIRTVGGTQDPSYRAEQENKAFNLQGSSPSDYPIYGFVYDGVHQRASDYGGVSVVLKDSVKHRSTVTVGDSLYDWDDNHVAASPMLAPTRASFGSYGAYVRTQSYDYIDYVEVQVHGGVSVNDIEKIVLQPWGSWDQYDSIISKASELGIAVDVSGLKGW